MFTVWCDVSDTARSLACVAALILYGAIWWRAMARNRQE